MYSIDGISINSNTLLNAYKMFYPLTYDKIISDNKFHYLYLWGIRVDTCDTSLPDDIIGGLRVNRYNMVETILSKASTEPSPRNLANLYDSEAVSKGGAAFVKEGEHLYYYYGKNHPKFKPLPAFAPKRPIPVYRWMPNNSDIKAWDNGKGKPLSSSFEEALKQGRVKQSTSSDTMIHKTWGKQKLLSDSAGCQVMTDDSTLIKLGLWAEEHKSMKYPNLFTYTLFTKDQFIKANTSKSSASKTSLGTSSKTTGNDWLKTLINLFRK